MNPTARRVLAVFAGLFASVGVILVIEGVSSALHPPTPGLDLRDPEQLRVFIGSLPLSAFLLVLTAWVLGAFIGATVAIRIARERPVTNACVVGGVVGVATVMNLTSLPHPVWMPYAAAVGIPLATWLAVRLAPNTLPPRRVG